MFNFTNIDAIEFEEICKQILERKIGNTFRVFGRGKDGGIDIQSNENPKIIGQVKLYINTPQIETVNKIKQEANRIDHKNIEQYYLFIGREMSPQNIEKIYEELKPILRTKENIFTIKEINELLNKEEYTDILRDHIKLWLCSTNILEQINNRNIFIDCDVLLDNIKEEVELFVQTQLYEICKDILQKDRLLLILGMPGIGKTTLSKMLVLNYAQLGYSVRYSNSQNIEELKKSLSMDKDKKEIVFLDDCLGQRYLELKEERENGIINLIKYIKRYPNKLLILNSRVTIFQEAKEKQYELVKCIDNKNIQIQVINIENLSKLEKARIFKHYLIKKELPKEYINEIVKNQNYMKIINDSSYNPRIIDYITEKQNYMKIKHENYVEEILNAFKKSKFVWKDEYENKIAIEDRIFLITLFSISDYAVKVEELKLAFYERIKKENIDTSTSLFERVLERLNQSFIKIVIKDDERLVMAVNPSVNDFMKEELDGNKLEKEKILGSAIFIEQIRRVVKLQEEYDQLIKDKINKNEFLKLKTTKTNQIKQFYLAHIIYYEMFEKLKEIDLLDTLKSLNYGYSIGKEYIPHEQILKKILYNNVKNEEQITKIFFNGEFLSEILYKETLEEQIEILRYIYEEKRKIEKEEILIKYVQKEFDEEPMSYSIDEIINDHEFYDTVGYEIEELKSEYEYDERWNEYREEDFKKELAERVKEALIEICSRDIQKIIDDLHCALPDGLYEKIECPQIGEWSFYSHDINEAVLESIKYVYKTPEEDYTYYKKYIYDGDLLNKKTDEDAIIHKLFSN